MVRKYLSLVLTALMLCAANLQIIAAQTGADNQPERNKLEKLKTKIYFFSLGEKAKVVVVKLKDGRKLKGYINQAIEDSFDLTDAKTKEITAIPYLDVAQVKRHGLSRGAKIAIGIGIVAGGTVPVLTLPDKNRLEIFARSAACRFKFMD